MSPRASARRRFRVLSSLAEAVRVGSSSGQSWPWVPTAPIDTGEERTKLPRPVPTRRRLCRQDPTRREAGRHSGRTADQIRSRREPGHGEGARPRSAADAARARRRGDRVTAKIKRREFIAASDLPAHSITSSASASNLSGISRPSAFAVLRLITSSNLVGCTIGRSAGLSPLRIRPE